MRNERPVVRRIKLTVNKSKWQNDRNRLVQFIRSLNTPEITGPSSPFNLNDREYEFLKLACSELIYNDIADRMCVSPRTVDGYRKVVFQKMGVRTRVGMVMQATRHGLVEL